MHQSFHYAIGALFIETTLHSNSHSKIKVLFTSHSSVVDVYQDKLRHIASNSDIELHVLLPEEYKEGAQVLKAHQGDGSYTVHLLPVSWAEQGYQNRFRFKGLGDFLEQLRPDIIHAEEEPESLVTVQLQRKASRLTPRPKFIGFTWRNWPMPLPHWPWWHPKRFIFNAIQRFTIPRFDAIIAGSNHSEKHIRVWNFGGPMPLIPQYGVDPGVYFPPTSPNEPEDGRFRLGFVGRVEQMKGLHVLVKALTKTDPSVHLNILGSGTYLSEIQSLVANQNLQDRVTFLSGVPAREVPVFLRSLHALCIPSLSTPQWREQFGRVVIEAMACGVPVIGSNSGEIPYVIGDAGIVCPEGDADSFAKAIELLRTDTDLRRSLIEIGIQRVKDNYTNQVIASKIVSLYHSLIGK